jgi:hypothetical protein
MNVVNQLPWEKFIDDSTWTGKDQYGFLLFFFRILRRVFGARADENPMKYRFQTLITKVELWRTLRTCLKNSAPCKIRIMEG